MPRPISEKTKACARLAAREQGVSCREVNQVTGMSWRECSCRLIAAEKAFGLFKAKPPGHHTRYFVSEAQFNA